MDRYPELGPKCTAVAFDDALEQVRKKWPRAHAEGSTGYERTWWSGEQLVAHHWPKRARDPEPMWLRVLDPD